MRGKEPDISGDAAIYAVQRDWPLVVLRMLRKSSLLGFQVVYQAIWGGEILTTALGSEKKYQPPDYPRTQRVLIGQPGAIDNIQLGGKVQKPTVADPQNRSGNLEQNRYPSDR